MIIFEEQYMIMQSVSCKTKTNLHVYMRGTFYVKPFLHMLNIIRRYLHLVYLNTDKYFYAFNP